MIAFLATHALRLLGGASIALLIAAGVLGFKLWRANEALDDERQAHKTTTAERDRFRDALAFYVNDGQIRTERGREAVREHEKVSQAIQRQIVRIRTVRASGGCETPREVLEAEGL